MDRWSNEMVEVRRRSLAMLPPGAPAGLSKEEAMEMLEQLQWCRSCGRLLWDALLEVAVGADQALGSFTASRPSE